MYRGDPQRPRWAFWVGAVAAVVWMMWLLVMGGANDAAGRGGAIGLAVFLGTVVVDAFRRGEIDARGPVATRQESPGMFWFYVVLYSVTSLIMGGLAVVSLSR